MDSTSIHILLNAVEARTCLPFRGRLGGSCQNGRTNRERRVRVFCCRSLRGLGGPNALVTTTEVGLRGAYFTHGNPRRPRLVAPRRDSARWKRDNIQEAESMRAQPDTLAAQQHGQPGVVSTQRMSSAIERQARFQELGVAMAHVKRSISCDAIPESPG